MQGLAHMKIGAYIILTAAFIAGILASQAYAAVHSTFSSTTYNGGYEFPADVYSGVTGEAVARAAPGDHVQESQIEVYQNKVVLDVKDAIWAKFTPTHSMDPVLSSTANAIEVVPKSEADVKVGDIVAYKSEYADGIIIHRVISEGTDQLGTYYIVKGDNNPSPDPGKVRFDQIKSVVVGIIY